MNARYPEPSPLHVALLEPEIPPNTGNIARTCLATFTPLHLVGRLGFRTDRRAVMRAGLDYWYDAEIHYHRTLEDLAAALPQSRMVYVETGAKYGYSDFAYQPGDILVFGRETRGLPEELVAANIENTVMLPMPNPRVRSINLATSAGIVLYHSLNALGYL